MRYLWLSTEHAAIMVQHARTAAPHEACGIIGGTGERAERIIPVPNAAADPLHHYRLNDADFVRAIYDLEAAGLELIGFYHSHPTGDALPSATDVRLATYPDSAYLIIGLRDRQPQLAAWQMIYGAVERLPLYIQAEPPAEHEPLTRAQKIAILISALFAFIIMVSASLYLLPPAPALPR